jgi:hypothetical protein
MCQLGGVTIPELFSSLGFSWMHNVSIESHFPEAGFLAPSGLVQRPHSPPVVPRCRSLPWWYSNAAQSLERDHPAPFKKAIPRMALVSLCNLQRATEHHFSFAWFGGKTRLYMSS